MAAGTRVADVMTKTVVSIGPDSRLDEAARLLRSHHISGLPVVGATHHVVGLLSERDIVKALHRATGIDSDRGLLDLLLESAPVKGESILEVCRRQLKNTRVRDAMTPEVVTVGPQAPIAEAAGLLREHGVKRLPIVDAQGRLVGILSRADVTQAVSGKGRTRRGGLRPGPSAAPTGPSGPFEDA